MRVTWMLAVYPPHMKEVCCQHWFLRFGCQKKCIPPIEVFLDRWSSCAEPASTTSSFWNWPPVWGEGFQEVQLPPWLAAATASEASRWAVRITINKKLLFWIKSRIASSSGMVKKIFVFSEVCSFYIRL